MAIDAAPRAYSTKLDRRISLAEERAAWTHARAHAARIHLAVVADRMDMADQSAGAIVVLADRRLRQLGGKDAA
jgi:hypothetical protein